MQFSGRKKRRAPTVIIVSLIDVLLVVLIFLMVSTTFKREQPALKLALPEAQSAKPGTKENKPPMLITIAAKAPYFYIADRAVTFEQLQNRLQGEAQQDPQLKVAIRADRQAPWGEVTRVIDVATIAKVGSLNFFTEKPAKP